MCDADGNILSVTEKDMSWFQVRERRDELLAASDLWLLRDRWDGLNTTQQEELDAYRMTLRDLPQDHPDDPNEAWDSIPEAPEVMQ
jgi:hypothetical protein